MSADVVMEWDRWVGRKEDERGGYRSGVDGLTRGGLVGGDGDAFGLSKHSVAKRSWSAMKRPHQYAEGLAVVMCWS